VSQFNAPAQNFSSAPSQATSFEAPNFTSGTGEAVHLDAPANAAGFGEAETSWLDQLIGDVGEMGFDDYQKLASQAFSGGGEGQDGGGMPMPAAPASTPLGAFGQAGSPFFHSMYGAPQRRGGGLF
jgi:hypothetical protein